MAKLLAWIKFLGPGPGRPRPCRQSHGNSSDAAQMAEDVKGKAIKFKNEAEAAPPVEVVAQPRPQVDIVVDEGPNMTASTYATWERLNINTARGGQPYYNTDNCLRFLTNETVLRDYLWYDEIFIASCSPSSTSPSSRPWGPCRGSGRRWIEIELMIHMQRHVGLVKMNLDMVRQAVKLYASKNIRNEPREWLSGLVWDGQPRLEAFFSAALGVEFSDYTAAASRNWAHVDRRAHPHARVQGGHHDLPCGATRESRNPWPSGPWVNPWSCGHPHLRGFQGFPDRSARQADR